MSEIAIDRVFSPELIGTGKLGGKGIEEGGFSAQVADQPIGFPIRDIFDELKVPIKLDLFKRFEVWMVPHRIAIMRRQGLAEPTSVGMLVEYESEGQTCMVSSLLPSFQFVTYGGLHARGNLSAVGEAKATLSLSGQQTPVVSKAGFDFSSSADAGINFEMKTVVCTPIISASGLGSSRCEWRFDKQGEPLFGRDIETWAAVVLPKRRTELTYRISFYLLTRTFMITTRRESDPVTVTCKLTR